MKWKVQRGWSASKDVGLFVGGIVVDDCVDDLSGRHGALDGVEEANELLVAMPSHAASDVRPLHMFERAIAIRDDGQQTLTIFGGRKDTDGLSHTHRIAHLPTSVNYPTVSVH